MLDFVQTQAANQELTLMQELPYQQISQQDYRSAFWPAVCICKSYLVLGTYSISTSKVLQFEVYINIVVDMRAEKTFIVNSILNILFRGEG